MRSGSTYSLMTSVSRSWISALPGAVRRLAALRDDLHSTAAAWYVVELADRFCEGAADSHEAFRLLAEQLSNLPPNPRLR